MNRKIISGISIGLLFLAFGLVSLLVILTKRNQYFIKRKLQIGALILTLSGISAGCRFPATCYVPLPDNILTVDQADSLNNSIILSKSVSDTLTGKISSRNGNAFSYAIYNSFNKIIIKDDILPVDGSFDEDNEEFSIGFGHAFLPGQYHLKFYIIPKDSIENSNGYANSYSLTVTE